MKLQMFTFFTLCDYAFRCVFELAAYRSANPNGKISLKPLFVERGMMGLMCLAVIFRDDSSASENWRCRDVFRVSTCFHMFPLLLVLRLGTYFAAFLFWLGLVFNISQGQARPHLAPPFRIVVVKIRETGADADHVKKLKGQTHLKSDIE